MRLVLRILWLSLLAAALSAPAAAAPISKSTVNTLCAALDAAMVRNDIEAVGKLISANARIISTNIVDGERQTVSYTKDEYLDALSEQLESLSYYRYERKTISIEIVDKGRMAIGKDRTIESMNMDGVRLRAVSTSTFIVELVKGVPLVTSIIGESTVMEMDGVYEI